MNFSDIPLLIENNLHSLYAYITIKDKDYKLNISENYSFIKSGSGSWPNFIFRINLKENNNKIVKKITEDVEKDIAPPFLITSSLNKNDNLIESLESYGFKQTMQWSGMAVNLSDIFYNENINNNNAEVGKVKNPEDLNSFFDIINEELFCNNKFNNNIFEKLTGNNNIRLYLAKINNKPVATSMLYISSGVAGIYMVSVLKDYRKKGLGTLITAKCIEEAVLSNCSICCLQATEMAENMYSNLGFKEFCKFDIYWKVGKY